MNTPVDPICAALHGTAAQIAVSTVRAHLSPQKTEAPRAVRDREMLGEIRTVHADNLGVYGARKVHAELCGKGFGVARCTVDRLMKADGLHLELADTAPTTTRAHLTGLRIHSVLNRELNASASEVAEYIE